MIELAESLQNVERMLVQSMSIMDDGGPGHPSVVGAWIGAPALGGRRSMREPSSEAVPLTVLAQSLRTAFDLDRRCCGALGADDNPVGAVLVSHSVSGLPQGRYRWDHGSCSFVPAPEEPARVTLQPQWDRAAALVVLHGDARPIGEACDYGPLLIRAGLVATAFHWILSEQGAASCVVDGLCPTRPPLPGGLDLIAVVVGGTR